MPFVLRKWRARFGSSTATPLGVSRTRPASAETPIIVAQPRRETLPGEERNTHGPQYCTWTTTKDSNQVCSLLHSTVFLARARIAAALHSIYLDLFSSTLCPSLTPTHCARAPVLSIPTPTSSSVTSTASKRKAQSRCSTCRLCSPLSTGRSWRPRRPSGPCRGSAEVGPSTCPRSLLPARCARVLSVSVPLWHSNIAASMASMASIAPRKMVATLRNHAPISRTGVFYALGVSFFCRCDDLIRTKTGISWSPFRRHAIWCEDYTWRHVWQHEGSPTRQLHFFQCMGGVNILQVLEVFDGRPSHTHTRRGHRACPLCGLGLVSPTQVEPDCGLVNGHKAAVHSIAFSPFQPNLMATGEGHQARQLCKCWKL